MKTTAIIVIASAFATACGDEPCSKTDADGSYLATAEERPNGTCGPLPDEVVLMNNGENAVGPGCVVLYERWSDDECSVDRAVTCDSQSNGTRTEIVGHLTQSGGGDVFTGTITATLSDLSSGSVICAGSYDMKYTRQ